MIKAATTNFPPLRHRWHNFFSLNPANAVYCILSHRVCPLSYSSSSSSPGAVEPEIKTVRTSLTGASDHRIDFGIPLSSSAASTTAPGSLGARRSSSRFGSIRNIKVSATLIRHIHFPRPQNREEVNLKYYCGALKQFLPLQIIRRVAPPPVLRLQLLRM